MRGEVLHRLRPAVFSRLRAHFVRDVGLDLDRVQFITARHDFGLLPAEFFEVDFARAELVTQRGQFSGYRIGPLLEVGREFGAITRGRRRSEVVLVFFCGGSGRRWIIRGRISSRRFGSGSRISSGGGAFGGIVVTVVIVRAIFIANSLHCSKLFGRHLRVFDRRALFRR
ncbi:MAG: hypothetical protein E6R03_01095, partial [Hyphomicrobiaceae bacterium]